MLCISALKPAIAIAGIMQFKPSTSMPGNAGTPVDLEGLDPQQMEQWYKTQEMQAQARQQHLESRQMEAEDMDNEDGAKKATGSTVAAMKAMKKTMKKPAVAKSDMKALKKFWIEQTSLEKAKKKLAAAKKAGRHNQGVD